MNRSHKRQGYLIAIVGVVLVVLARGGLNAALDQQAVLLPFVLAVVAAAWRGGLGPGLLATALGIVTGVFFFLPPPGSLLIGRIDHGITALLFVAIGITISALCEALHDARRRETEKQFRTLADSIPQLVWMARPDGARFWFNQQWYDYTGAKPRDVLGWGWQSLHDQDDLPAVLDGWRAALRDGQPWEATVRLRRRDGQMRWQLARARPVRNRAGEIECWFGTHTDITERLEAEHALYEADRRKDEFLATLAHELRNPLSPISHIVELWPLVQDDKVEMEHLRLIMQRQVQQMTRLIEDLMDASRIGRGKAVLKRQDVELEPLVVRAAEESQPLLESRRHELVVHPSAEPLIVHGDPARLTQVFANLLNNAAKYTPPGGTIWVTSRADAEQVTISVRDSGTGIAPDKLGTIFEMFEQLEDTPDRTQGGLGIGLTLVKRLVEMHGGSVEARSAGLGHGSEFIVTLPRVSVAATVVVTTELPAHPSVGHPAHELLVVDDQAAAADTLALLLRSMGQSVSVVHDGRAALSLMHERKPDAVILDINLPGMNGYEVAREVRQCAGAQDVFLVALTGYGRDEDRLRAYEAGFDLHLTKPAGRKALDDMLAMLATTTHAAHPFCNG